MFNVSLSPHKEHKAKDPPACRLPLLFLNRTASRAAAQVIQSSVDGAASSRLSDNPSADVGS